MGTHHVGRRVHAEPALGPAKAPEGEPEHVRRTFCRFVYAVPLALAYVALLGEGLGFEWPVPNSRFALFAMLGGVTQITATALLIYLFSLRNFAVGTTYSKTETVQTAVFGLVILGVSRRSWGFRGCSAPRPGSPR